MKRVLLVDDDPLILRLYQDGLSRRGFQVETAADGLAAMRTVRTFKPDIVVLDLMMPNFSGVEVLKFIRAQPDLQSVPVIVLSNSYMNDLAGEAATVGARMALLKVRCTPARLEGVIKEVLEGQAPQTDASDLLAVPKAGERTAARIRPPEPIPVTPLPERLFGDASHRDRSSPPPGVGPKAEPAAPPPKVAAPPARPGLSAARNKEAEAERKAKARQEFLADAAATCGTLRMLGQAFVQAAPGVDRELRLQNLYRKVRFLVATAGLVECPAIGQVASVLEALLFSVTDRPALVSASVLQTITEVIDFFEPLFRASRQPVPAVTAAQILAVDDDPLQNRLVVEALRRAQLQARSTEDPQAGLTWLGQEHFDLVLLDVELPGLDGFEFCRRLRAVKGYESVPVIYVTGHDDFEHRRQGELSGGNNLISKPVLPLELAAKVVTLLLQKEISESAA